MYTTNALIYDPEAATGGILYKKVFLNDTHREKTCTLLNSVQKRLAASDVFHMFTQSIKVVPRVEKTEVLRKG